MAIPPKKAPPGKAPLRPAPRGPAKPAPPASRRSAAPAAPAKNPLPLYLGIGGGALALILILVVVFSGGGHDAPAKMPEKASAKSDAGKKPPAPDVSNLEATGKSKCEPRCMILCAGTISLFRACRRKHWGF